MKEQDEMIVIEEPPSRSMWMNFWIFFCVIWSLLGLMAFATSCVCFFYDGQPEQKWLGLVVSILMGPFYWFYFATIDVNYCAARAKSAGKRQTRSPRQVRQR